MPDATPSPLILDGVALRDLMVGRLAKRVAAAGSPSVCLATVLVGDDAPSHTYVRNKHKFAAAAGLQSRNETLPATASQAQVEDLVGGLAADPTVHGILVQQPLPEHLDNDAVLRLLPAVKDVDGLTAESLGRLVRGEPGLVPCTPLGVLRLLEHYKIPTAGKHAVIVGRSTLVGTPLALLLSRKGVDATATIAHSRTSNLAELCRSADIVVGASGQARMRPRPLQAGRNLDRRRNFTHREGSRGRHRFRCSSENRGCHHADARWNRPDDDCVLAREHAHRRRVAGRCRLGSQDRLQQALQVPARCRTREAMLRRELIPRFERQPHVDLQ